MIRCHVAPALQSTARTNALCVTVSQMQGAGAGAGAGSAPCLSVIIGVVVARRVLSQVAFATILPTVGAPAADTESDATACCRELVTDAGGVRAPTSCTHDRVAKGVMSRLPPTVLESSPRCVFNVPSNLVELEAHAGETSWAQRAAHGGSLPAHSPRPSPRQCTRVGNVVCVVYNTSTSSASSSGSAAGSSGPTHRVVRWEVMSPHRGRGFSLAATNSVLKSTSEGLAAQFGVPSAQAEEVVSVDASAVATARELLARKSVKATQTINPSATDESKTADAGGHRPLCRRWGMGRCKLASVAPRPGTLCSGSANLCTLRHYFVSADEERTYALLAEKSRVAAAVASKSVDDDEHHGGDGVLPKAARASMFADWVVAKWGVDRLKLGTGVVDVAGGKGLVASRLALAYGIPATVLDPVKRRQSPPKRVAKALRKAGRAHLLAYVHERLEAHHTMHHSGVDDGGGATSASGDAVSSLLQSASLVVGMHPDEATEVC